MERSARQRSARTGSGLRTLMRHGSLSVRRWLAPGISESVRLEISPSPGPAAGRGLCRELQTAADRVRSRRALLVGRRHLTAALAVAVLAELAVILAGGDHRGAWLLAPVVAALAGGAIAWSRPIGLERAAQMLDRRLNLHDLLVTALEILRREPSPAGLEGLVVQEARAAASGTRSRVRIVAVRPGHEWAWLLAAAALLVFLATVPGLGDRGSPHRRGGAPPQAAGAASSRAATAAAAEQAAKATEIGASSGRVDRPPLAITNGGSSARKESGFTPYGHGGTSLAAKQLAQDGIASPPPSKNGLASLAVGESGGGGLSTATSSPTPAAAAGGQAAGTGETPATGSAKGLSTARTESTAGGGQSSGSHGSGTARQGAAGGSAAGGASSHGAGGNAAGTGVGSNALRSGLEPVLAGGSSALPLQAGYTAGPDRRQSGSEGVSQTANGGGTGGRSAQTNAGGEASVSSGLTVIPPTSDASSAVEEGLLSNYFGSSNQLALSNW